ncbi:MAG: hypothetical protein JSS81_25500 [Acidobacteria bacterium]|nr:hypothetical protein [Acidobacteriota bacterium]
MPEKADQRAASKDNFSRRAGRKPIHVRERRGIFPNLSEFGESFFISAASLKFDQTTDQYGNVCVENIHNEIKASLGIIGSIPQSINSKKPPWRKKQ